MCRFCFLARPFAPLAASLTYLFREQHIPKLNPFTVDELVNYGLAGNKAPAIAKTATHLEPDDYHKVSVYGLDLVISRPLEKKEL